MCGFCTLLKIRASYKFEIKCVTYQISHLMSYCPSVGGFRFSLHPKIQLFMLFLTSSSSSCHLNRKSTLLLPPLRMQQPTHVPAPVTQPSSGTQGSAGEIQPLVPLNPPPLPPPAKRASVGPAANPVSTPQPRLKASSDRFILLRVAQSPPGITVKAPQHSPPPGSLASSPDMAVYTLAILCSLMDLQLKRASKRGALVKGTC